MNQAISWLNDWENNLENKLIDTQDFLTQATCDGLKITLKSTLDLVNYLLVECNFAYVLTAKLNQDSLEVHNIILHI